MAKVPLYIPEEDLAEFIAIVRAGLEARPETDRLVREGVESWLEEHEEYLQEMRNDG